MKWEYLTLDKLGSISRGKSKHRPRNDKILFGGKYPFIQTADVKAANLYLTEYKNTYNEKGLEQSKLWKAGTLCITIAANIAETAILGIDACFPDSIMGFVPFKGVSNVKFIKYVFDILKNNCRTISQGTAQDNLSWEKLSRIEFPAPPIEVQNKIVDILSAYDDLIENNQKQIKLLEEAAQRLYKEWFVNLRFPGYENTPIIDGVPKGWKKEDLINLVDIQYGYAFKGSLFNNIGKGMPIIRIRNIPDGQTTDFTTEKVSKEYIIHNGDILVGMDGEFYVNSWGGEDAYLVQRTCCFRTKFNNMKGYLLQAILEPIKFFEKTVVGATVTHLGKKHINTIKIFSVPNVLYEPFQMWYEKRQSLVNQNRLLTEARNRLISQIMGRKFII